MHASLVWSDLNAAAVIRGAVHLLHHVFLTILFGIFSLAVDPHARLSRLSKATFQGLVQGNAH
ncbi:hypothetical protein BST65_19210 [Bradyrhizobium canariense]|nr:hypothetical protein BST65_19210 [Bradyrhizobium canariense]OSI27278.1 hypothetical protein BST66_34085 [Bradyrhizobium canariense]OSI39142.1 hypothetical protein BSZ20_32220 [Bradyrhizobium canariense]OSI43265.1 hypothetical protein BST67_34800 [Bradyrhizobium canariense]OSI52082.1 hypothetical protein BSZ15_28880 [Bradyrhizobium canariense]